MTTFRRWVHLKTRGINICRRRVSWMKRTYDTNLEVIAWATKQSFLFWSGGLFGRHCSLLLCREDCGDVEAATGAVREDVGTGSEEGGESRRERTTRDGEQPSESISLHRIFATQFLSNRPPRKADFELAGGSRLLPLPTGLGGRGMRSSQRISGDCMHSACSHYQYSCPLSF